MTVAVSPAAGPRWSATTLYTIAPRHDATRWGVAALVMLLLHAGAFAAIVAWPAITAAPGPVAPAILIDLAPASAAPETPLELAPGPPMLEAAAPPAEDVAPPHPVETAIPPTPMQPNAVVSAPAKSRVEPAPETPPRHAAAKHQVTPRAPRSTAPPKAQHLAAAPMAAAAGASAAAASYTARLAAHLQRFKQYPSAARAAGDQGTAVLVFTVSRSGQVLASHLGRSSGSAALDAETLALLRRAQPLPPFPAEMTQSSKTLSVPLSYALH